jgi:hypothetical protein
MRKLIVCNIMSLDGYYEGPDGNVMVLPLDAAFDDLLPCLRQSRQVMLLKVAMTSLPSIN